MRLEVVLLKEFQKSFLIKGLVGLFSVGLVSTFAFQLYQHKHNNIELPEQITENKIVELAPVKVDEPEVSQERHVTHKISKGETLQSILCSLGVDAKQATQAIKELQKIYNPKALKVDQEINIHYETAVKSKPAQICSLKFRSTGAHEIILDHKAGASQTAFTAHKKELKLTRVLRRVEGHINSSFYSAALKRGVPANVVKEAISALSYDVNWQHDPKQKDPYCMVFEAFEDEKGNVARCGELQFAAFAPGGGKWRKIYAFKTGNSVGYYNDKGESVVKSLLRTPVDSTKMRITSKFGVRVHPLKGYTAKHKGIDFGAPTGTPVSAAGDGVVVRAGWYGGYGNYVLIRHNKDYSTAYGHLSKIQVKAGQAVKQRQIIGNVGSTGNSTGPHLHHEVIYKGTQINPQSVKQLPSSKLSSKELATFMQVRRQLEEGMTSFMDANGSNPIEIVPAVIRTTSKKKKKPLLQMVSAKSSTVVG